MSDLAIQLSTVILLGGGVATLLLCLAILGYGAARIESREPTGRPGRGVRGTVAGIALVLGVWFAWAVATSLAGPLEFGVVIPGALLAITIGSAATFLPGFRRLLEAAPTSWLIWAQFYRVLGVLFIVPYLTSGVLTPGFALLAGIGDVITGVLAIPVALLVARRGRGARVAFWAWTAFGILDLIVAPSAAAIFGFEAVGQNPGFPITTIPLFFGPPFGILIHIVTLRSFSLHHPAGPTTPDSQREPLVVASR
ncbi:MAG: hypothetical protein ACRCYQ_06215 [Nocardioides sp.]